MVRNSSRHARRWSNIARLGLATLLVAISLASCGGPSDATLTASPPPTTPARTATPTPSSPDATSTVATLDATEPVPEPEPSEASVSIDPEALGAEVASLVSEIDGLVEIVVALPDGTTLTELNSDEPIEAASLYKLAIMVEVYVERETGELAFDDQIVLDSSYFVEEDSVFGEGDIGFAVSIETLVHSMIALSSNVAATALLARVGNESVNLTMQSLGLASTEIRWSPAVDPEDPVPEETEPVDDEEPDGDEPTEVPAEEPTVEDEPTEEEGRLQPDRALLVLPARLPLLDPRADAALNVTTAADIAALYVMLLNGQVVSAAASHEMLALLMDQQINDRLPAYLPYDTVVAHKTGNLDGLVHDAGAIYAPAGPIVVVVLTEDVAEWQANDLIARIGRLAYDTTQ